MPNTLSIDLETYSDVDLKACGMYRYIESPVFEIMLFAFKADDSHVAILDLKSGEKIPPNLIQALIDPNVIKTAYNAPFEINCLQKHLGITLPVNQWRCTMAHAAYIGLPGTLGDVAEVLNFPTDKKKMGVGKSLINYFCKPCKPSKVNSGRTRNLPEHDPARWDLFKQYCTQDVVTEDAVRKKLSVFPLPEPEQKLWELDQEINSRGVLVDPVLVRNAIACDEQYQERVLNEAIRLTGLENPRSVAQIKKWLLETEDEEVPSLNKKTVPKLIQKLDNPTTKRVLELRQELSKASVKKYKKIQECMCSDDRIRGLLQYYGANRTGRWAGRLVQVQNLPQNHLKDLELGRELIRSGKFDEAEMMFGSPASLLSELIRTSFIPAPEHRFIVADFSAIEARVIAWLANERWRMEVFKTHGKIYEASAAAMFKVPIETIDKGNPLRQKGKIAELALGYQGGKGALITMGALEMGLTEEELPGLVDAWRAANLRIVKLWYDVGNAFWKVVEEKTTVQLQKGITISHEKGMVFIQLPSGRRLCYPKAHIGYYGWITEKGKPKQIFKSSYVADVSSTTGMQEGIIYFGVNQKTKKWGPIPTYGGKLVENIIQAIARDCLATALYRINSAGLKTIMHVHDEVIIEDVRPDNHDTKFICDLMSEPIPWAKDLPLGAAGFVTSFYRKD